MVIGRRLARAVAGALSIGTLAVAAPAEAANTAQGWKACFVTQKIAIVATVSGRVTVKVGSTVSGVDGTDSSPVRYIFYPTSVSMGSWYVYASDGVASAQAVCLA